MQHVALALDFKGVAIFLGHTLYKIFAPKLITMKPLFFIEVSCHSFFCFEKFESM